MMNEQKLKDLAAEFAKGIKTEEDLNQFTQLLTKLTQHHPTVPSSSTTAKAINYSLKRWPALSRYLDDGNLPIDNNWAENSMRPWALGRKNWLFAGSLRSGQRAANIMTLIQSDRKSVV